MRQNVEINQKTIVFNYVIILQYMENDKTEAELKQKNKKLESKLEYAD